MVANLILPGPKFKFSQYSYFAYSNCYWNWL